MALTALQKAESATLVEWSRRDILPFDKRVVVDADQDVAPRFGHAAIEGGVDRPVKEHGANGVSPRQLAQFQLPPDAPESGVPPKPLVQQLTYQYGYGSESPVEYRRDRDLDKRVRDNSLIVTPQVNGYITYRPNAWLETTLELIMEKEFPVQEEQSIVLPSGETQIAKKRYLSIPVDQAFFLIKYSPMEFAAGRRNYEDERHWLYDTSMDIASIAVRKGGFGVEAFWGKEVRWDWDLAPNSNQFNDRVDTYILYGDYRGFEDHRLAAYTIIRDDDRTTKQGGHPRLTGVRVLAAPTANLNYWVELASLRGTDELNQKISAAGGDIGGTYRFSGLPFGPNITVGYAFATGDGNPNDGKNKEFRQSGLQSNESRFAGVTKFKYYGEVVDPELSNLGILTVGLGFRLAPGVSLDLVYHRYQLDKIADSIRNSQLTAQMNQDDTQLSKDMGRAFDIVLGIRNLFGVRRLGLDLRAGWFYPGKAFRNAEGDPDNPTFRPADRGYSVVAKMWW
jgi:alginate production protein